MPVCQPFITPIEGGLGKPGSRTERSVTPETQRRVDRLREFQKVQTAPMVLDFIVGKSQSCFVRLLSTLTIFTPKTPVSPDPHLQAVNDWDSLNKRGKSRNQGRRHFTLIITITGVSQQHSSFTSLRTFHELSIINNSNNKNFSFLTLQRVSLRVR